MINLNSKQYKVIAKMWIASMLEATGDRFVDEPGVCNALTNEQINLLGEEIRAVAMNIRGAWPVKRSIADIIQYLTGETIVSDVNIARQWDEMDK